MSNTVTPAMIESINEVALIVHRNAREKGFHPDTESTGQYISQTCANIHGEVSEFWEAHRKGKLNEPCDKVGCGLTNAEEELADVVIRAFDTAARLNINIGSAIAQKHTYNTTRPYRHGDKNA